MEGGMLNFLEKVKAGVKNLSNTDEKQHLEIKDLGYFFQLDIFPMSTLVLSSHDIGFSFSFNIGGWYIRTGNRNYMSVADAKNGVLQKLTEISRIVGGV